MGSTLDGDVKITGGVKVGNATNPPETTAGSGAINTTNKTNGSLHLRTDENTTLECMHNSAAEKLGFAQHAIECRLSTLVANSTNTYKTYMPRDGVVTGVSRRFTLKPASAAGTVVTGITGDGNALLQSASEDEEGITNDTLTAHTLTATSANLRLSKGDPIIITITSNNADMTDGTGGAFHIYYEDN